jgi:Mrp family chromosome partitioning ATPase
MDNKFLAGVTAGITAASAVYLLSQIDWNKVRESIENRLSPKAAIIDVPVDANEECPGVGSNNAGKSSACDGCPNQTKCASGEASKPDPAVAEVARRLENVEHKILVLSGKGGVGKSTVSAQLTFGLAHPNDLSSSDVGLLDIDICGPSIPRMMGIATHEVHNSAEGWSPVYVDENISVMSVGFMLPDPDSAIVWRGPKKHALIKQFLTDVNWGHLDYLVVDTPPGTSDEHMSIVGLLKGVDGAVLVTTPQEVSLQDVRKEISFCRKTGIKIIGVVENMSGFVCPSCSECTDVFSPSTGGAEAMCKQLGIPFLGKLPLTGSMTKAGDTGASLVHSMPQLKNIVEAIRAQLG